MELHRAIRVVAHLVVTIVALSMITLAAAPASAQGEPEIQFRAVVTLDDANGNGGMDVGEQADIGYAITAEPATQIESWTITDPQIADGALDLACPSSVPAAAEVTCSLRLARVVTQADVARGQVGGMATMAGLARVLPGPDQHAFSVSSDYEMQVESAPVPAEPVLDPNPAETAPDPVPAEPPLDPVLAQPALGPVPAVAAPDQLQVETASMDAIARVLVNGIDYSVAGPGDTVVLQYDVTNTGTAPLDGLMINDPLLASRGIAVTCPAGSLAAGATTSCTSGPIEITAEMVATVPTGTQTGTASAGSVLGAVTETYRRWLLWRYGPNGWLTPPTLFGVKPIAYIGSERPAELPLLSGHVYVLQIDVLTLDLLHTYNNPVIEESVTTTFGIAINCPINYIPAADGALRCFSDPFTLTNEMIVDGVVASRLRVLVGGALMGDVTASWPAIASPAPEAQSIAVIAAATPGTPSAAAANSPTTSLTGYAGGELAATGVPMLGLFSTAMLLLGAGVGCLLIASRRRRPG